MSAEIVQVLTDAGWPAAGVLTAHKVFGPSLGVLGTNLGEWVDKWTTNFLRIADRAETKLGSAAEDPGEVPPRVMQRILTDAAWTDDPVSQDYYAGLAASSRSEEGNDDSNVPLLSVLASLGSRDIRLHYLIYKAIREGLHGGWSMGQSEGRTPATLYLPATAVAQGMDWSVEEAVRTMPEVVATLARVGLIEQQPWATGGGPSLNRVGGRSWEAPAPGLVISPSWLGLNLAIRADGPSAVSTSHYLYTMGWTELPEVEFDAGQALFPKAPATQEALMALREKVGHAHNLPALGWAISNLPVEVGEDPNPGGER